MSPDMIYVGIGTIESYNLSGGLWEVLVGQCCGVCVCPEHIMFTMMRNVDGTWVWTGGLPSQDIHREPQGPGLMIALWCAILQHCNTNTDNQNTKISER